MNESNYEQKILKKHRVDGNIFTNNCKFQLVECQIQKKIYLDFFISSHYPHGYLVLTLSWLPLDESECEEIRSAPNTTIRIHQLMALKYINISTWADCDKIFQELFRCCDDSKMTLVVQGNIQKRFKGFFVFLKKILR